MKLTIDWPRLGRAAFILVIPIYVLPATIGLLLWLDVKRIVDVALPAFVVTFALLVIANLIGAWLRAARRD